MKSILGFLHDVITFLMSLAIVSVLMGAIVFLIQKIVNIIDTLLFGDFFRR